MSKLHWLFLEIEPPTQPWPFDSGDMVELTTDQCVQAVEHAQQHGGIVELYLADKPLSEDIPYVGLLFDKTGYRGYGLGSSVTEGLERYMAGYIGKLIDEGKTALLSMFRDPLAV